MSKSNQEIIDERKANLPLPDDPPTASDFSSADARNVNVSASDPPTAPLKNNADGLVGSAVREPASTGGPPEGLENVGRQGKDDLGGLPNDAVARGKKDKEGLAHTTGKDYGYPQKSDPSEGLK